MSSDIAVRVEGLSKRYHLQHRAVKEGLRHAVQRAFSSPFRRIRSAFRPGHNGWNGLFSHGEQGADEFWALKDVSFEIKRGEVVGIIGRNGAGKSTLLKTLCRITEPTTGRIEINGRVASLLEVGTGFHPELTGRENIFLNGAILGMSRAEVRQRFDEIVAFAEVERFLDTPVKRYSSGMYVRLAFAVAAHLEPEVLIVDEVLAVGDAEFQQKCLGRMDSIAKDGNRTVLFVSHNMAAVSTLCKSCILMKGGRLELQAPSSAAIAAYLGRGSSSSTEFETGPLKRVEVRQEDEGIAISASYDVATEIDMPCLGFVIYDSSGSPICGTNPRISEGTLHRGHYRTGNVEVFLRHPRLLDGTYLLSVWFGDTTQDFVSQPHCLTFTITGLAGARQLPPAIVGPVNPLCEWSLS